MEKKEVKWGKWFALGLGGLIGCLLYTSDAADE